MASNGGTTLPKTLDMGIWEDGAGARVWLPKHFYPTRNNAKRFAMDELGQTFLEIRVKTAWMHRRNTLDELWGECERTEVGAFECWEIA